jgi:hypothetical protein
MSEISNFYNQLKFLVAVVKFFCEMDPSCASDGPWENVNSGYGTDGISKHSVIRRKYAICWYNWSIYMISWYNWSIYKLHVYKINTHVFNNNFRFQ